MKGFFVYILECADTSLYCGSTNDIAKRLREHNTAKRGAKYTKTRRPVVLRFAEACESLGSARSREAGIKRMTRREKLTLIREARTKRGSISALSVAERTMGKGDNSQRKEKKKPKKEKKK